MDWETRKGGLRLGIAEAALKLQEVNWSVVLNEEFYGIGDTQRVKPDLEALTPRIVRSARSAPQISSVSALETIQAEVNRLTEWIDKLTINVHNARSAGENHEQIRKDYIQSITNAVESSHRAMDSVESYVKIAEIASNLDTESNQSLLEQLSSAIDEANRLKLFLAREAGNNALGANKADPQVPSEKSIEIDKQLQLHAVLTSVFGALALGLLLWLGILVFGSHDSLSTVNSTQALIVLSVPKIFLLGLALILSRICFASWHNYIVCRNRRHILSTYRQLSAGISNPDIQERLLLLVYNSACSFQPTGFTKSPVENAPLPASMRDALAAVEDVR